MLHVKYAVSLLCFNSLVFFLKAATYYLTTERPVVQFANPKYVSFVNVTARRYVRRNPIYYVDIHVTTLLPADNNVVVQIYFFEYIYNQYHRSQLEFNFKWCHMFQNDMFFAMELRKNLPQKCPHPAGSYHLHNLTLNADAIPPGFPFTKGRLLVNVTYHDDPVASAYSDLELKKYKKPKI